MGVNSQLLTGFRYLRVSGDGKRLLDLGLPIALTAASLAIDTFVVPISVIGERGLIQLINELLQVLVGFYVASLAAVATFASTALEQKAQNLYFQGKLMRRRAFLCYMFGYLSVLSLTLYVVGVMAILGASQLHAAAQSVPPFRSVALAVYMFFAWNMVTVTLMGLHYLIDRAQRADPMVKPDTGDTPESPAKQG